MPRPVDTQHPPRTPRQESRRPTPNSQLPKNQRTSDPRTWTLQPRDHGILAIVSENMPATTKTVAKLAVEGRVTRDRFSAEDILVKLNAFKYVERNEAREWMLTEQGAAVDLNPPVPPPPPFSEDGIWVWGSNRDVRKFQTIEEAQSQAGPSDRIMSVILLPAG